MANSWLEGLDLFKNTPNRVCQQPPLVPMTSIFKNQSREDVGHTKNWCKVFGNPNETYTSISILLKHDLPSHINLPLGLPKQCGRSMHQKFNKWHKKKKVLHILARGVLRGYGLTSLVVALIANPWNKGEKCDNKEWDLNKEHPFPRILGY